MQAISGLLRAKSGDILFKEKYIKKEKAYRISRAGIGHVPEGRRIFSDLNVEDNLIVATIAIKNNDTKINEEIKKIYDLFPVLKERKSQKAGTLSGGEQQMLAMARALLAGAKVLLLDEPSMGLSPLFVEKIFDTLKILKKAGKTILLVEQNVNLALDIADRAYVLETGKIVKEGQASDLKNDSAIKSAYLGM